MAFRSTPPWWDAGESMQHRNSGSAHVSTVSFVSLISGRFVGRVLVGFIVALCLWSFLVHWSIVLPGLVQQNFLVGRPHLPITALPGTADTAQPPDFKPFLPEKGSEALGGGLAGLVLSVLCRSNGRVMLRDRHTTLEPFGFPPELKGNRLNP